VLEGIPVLLSQRIRHRQHFDGILFADATKAFAASSSCSSHLDWQTINKVDNQ
jgi:hypothetical protein